MSAAYPATLSATSNRDDLALFKIAAAGPPTLALVGEIPTSDSEDLNCSVRIEDVESFLAKHLLVLVG